MNILFKTNSIQRLQTKIMLSYMRRKPFEILGVHPQSSEKQIKSAYYRLAKQLHPDICKQANAGEKFNNLNQAYEIMMAQASSKQQQTQQNFYQQDKNYQQYKKSDKKSNYRQFYTKPSYQKINPEEILDFQRAFNHWIKFGKVPKGNRFSTIFQEIYRGVRRQKAFYYDEDDDIEGEDFDDYVIYQRKWSKKVKKQQADLMKKYNIELELNLSLQQIAKNCTKVCFYKYIRKYSITEKYNVHHALEIIIHKKSNAKKCKGTGCFTRQKRYYNKLDVSSSSCSNCFGKGYIKKSSCHKCQGKSKIQVKNTQKIKVSENLQNGSLIILKKKGHQNLKNKQFGNVIIKVYIDDHPSFKKQGFDITSDRKITISQAILGSLIDVETLRGVEKIKLMQGTEDGQVIVLQGLGLKRKNGKYGDHYVTISIDYNKDYSEQELKCFYQIRQIQSRRGGR